MLPPTIRFQAINNTGVAFGASDTLSFTGKFIYETLSTGVLSAAAQSTPLPSTSGNSLASGGVVNSSTIDATNLGGGGAGTTLALQFDGILSASISTATPNGTVDLYMQASPDGGTTWPDNGKGILVKSIKFTATGSQAHNAIVIE